MSDEIAEEYANGTPSEAVNKVEYHTERKVLGPGVKRVLTALIRVLDERYTS